MEHATHKKQNIEKLKTLPFNKRSRLSLKSYGVASVFRIPRSTNAFTLVELMVSIAIMVIITSALIIGYSSFGNNILLTNLAYDIALTFRQAQSYGVSVREFNPSSGQFPTSYGVHFGSDSNISYILFADTGMPNDHKYTGISEAVKAFQVTRANRLSKFCGVYSNGSKQCYDLKAKSGQISFLDITFARPDPDALIVTNLGSGYQKAQICVIAPSGITKSVEVSLTGQISVLNSCL